MNEQYASEQRASVAKLQLALLALELLKANNALTTLVLRGPHGPTREALVQRLRSHHRVHRAPSNTEAHSVFGSVDACASLASGSTVHTAPLLRRTDFNCLVLANAENWSTQALFAVKASLENPELSNPDLLLVALDESHDEEAGFGDTGLADLFALHVDVTDVPYQQLQDEIQQFDKQLNAVSRAATSDAKPANSIPVDDKPLLTWLTVAESLGITSLRTVQHCVKTACALAALHGRMAVNEDDQRIAVQLVLGPRARCLPSSDVDENAEQDNTNDSADTPPDDDPNDDHDTPPEQPAPEPETPPEQDNADAIADAIADANTTEPPPPTDPADATTLVAAAQATLPAHLLAGLAANQAKSNAQTGRDASQFSDQTSGRPTGTRKARNSGRGERLNLLATLQQAAPWQKLRKQSQPTSNQRVVIYPSDLQVTRFSAPVRNTTLFIVDASGSAALHRLAEAKGAVELLLNECYVRRDRVALITFRGEQANLDLPPTRSLVRAKRALQGLPGGGGTPLAHGLQLASTLLKQLNSAGESTVGVVLSDGKANIGLDGTQSREQARQDALVQARHLAALGTRLLFVDTAPRPQATARQIAEAMNARYLPLPHGQKFQLNHAVQQSANTA